MNRKKLWCTVLKSIKRFKSVMIVMKIWVTSNNRQKRSYTPTIEKDQDSHSGKKLVLAKASQRLHPQYFLHTIKVMWGGILFVFSLNLSLFVGKDTQHCTVINSSFRILWHSYYRWMVIQGFFVWSFYIILTFLLRKVYFCLRWKDLLC